MKPDTPKVSIGLPVYNGENYLAEAIESILNQTFTDFELIICDNASTDATENICQKYASQDARVQYYKNEKNLGASGNYTRVFELASGEYFKWAAHDDVCLPKFLERCVQILDEDPTVSLAHTQAASIDENSQVIMKFDDIEGLDLPHPVDRFQSALQLNSAIFYIWGLMRRKQMVHTPLLANYVGHDRPFLSRMSLFGRFHQHMEILFHQREHPDRSVHKYNWRRPRISISWYDPTRVNKLSFPTWRLMYEHFKGINAADLSFNERFTCYKHLWNLAILQKEALWNDIILATDFLLPTSIARWIKHFNPIIRDIEKHIPEESLIILVDQEMMETEVFGNRLTMPFLEKDGIYWGPPTDDEQAIQELKRQQEEGASFIVFAPPAFWWLDYYKGFHEYLKSTFPCLLNNKRFVIYDLR